MKKLLIITGIFFSLALSVNAQQLPMFSQYMFNGFLLNPAETGSNPKFPIILTGRQQWAGIDGAPLTFTLSAHTMFSSNKMGVGGYIFHDGFGPVSRTGLLVSYAYHLDLPGIKSRLAFGISAMAFQYQMKTDDFILSQQGGTNIQDDLVSGAKETAIVPDANFGMRLYNDRYFVGIAGTQLIQLKMNMDEIATEDFKMVRHYFAMGGYKFILSDYFELEPSVMFKITERSPMNFDGNIKVVYDKKYWLGVSFRTSKEIITMIGVKIKFFSIGYAFDYGFNELYDYAKFGSHEVMIGFELKDDTGGSTLF